MSEVNKNQWKVNYLYRLKELCNKDLESLYANKLEPEYKCGTGRLNRPQAD